MSLTPLDLRYDASVRRVWTSVLGNMSRQWTDLKSWRGSDVAGFQRKSLPVLMAGQRQVASLTTTYLERLYQEIANESSRVDLNFDKVTGAALRNGVDPTDVYERPFKEVWYALSKGEPLDVAVDRGAHRLETLAKTDLQLARTHTAVEVTDQQPAVSYTIREPIGEYNCALCLIASTQRYRKRDLLPIHPGCDCLVKIVKGDYDPGQVIDEAKLNAIHRAVEDALGTYDRGGRAVDYRQIIVQHDHGEIGPVIGFKGQNFTGPDDIKSNGDHPQVPTVAEPTANVSGLTRRQIEDAKASLPTTREDWLNDRRKVIAPAGRLVDQRLAEDEAKLKELQLERERIVAETEAEFKRRRTPKYKRHNLLEEATWSLDGKISQQQSFVNDFQRIANASPDELNQNDRHLLTEVPAQYEFTYPKDENGSLLPPKAYDGYLDSVLNVGYSLRDDLREAFKGDSELERLRTAASDLAAAGADPASAEMQKARRDVASRESALIHTLLRDVRQMDGDAPAKLADAPPADTVAAPDNWRDQLAEAFRHFPSDWLSQMSTDLHVVGSERAYYSAGGSYRPDVMALSTYVHQGYDGAFSSYATEVATHELGHRMEQYIPGLRELEFVLVRRRATSNGVLDVPKNMADLLSYYKREDNEMTYEDHWVDPYTGKTYEAWNREDPAENSSEAFQVGLQDLFGRGTRRYGDAQLQAFVLAVLALL